MEVTVKIAWGLLALAHAPPAAVFFAPRLVSRLYGEVATGAVGLLLSHRGALFLAVAVACVIAVFDPGGRRLASIVVGISMASFVLLYAQAGFPSGPLRRVALVDAAALAPLALVSVDAWGPFP